MGKKVDDQTILALVLTGQTQTAIAKELHMSKSQLCNRINQSDFQEQLYEYRKRVIEGILTELVAHSQKSVMTIVALLDDENPYLRLQAASKILSMTETFAVQRDIMREIEEWKESHEREMNDNRYE